ncbi:MAG: minor capsid protein [Eubacterium sp.]|nr:minor capsid protein [Eubacterium sp.]
MYTSDEIGILPNRVEEIYRALENDIMFDIIRRIRETGEITRTADWQMYRLYQMGETKEKIKKHIQQALQLSDAEIDMIYSDTLKMGYARDEELYNALGKEFISYNENIQLQQLISGVKEQTYGELKNITQTMGFSVKQPNGKKQFQSINNYFKNTMDNAVMHLLNGTFDYNTIIRKVTDEMTKSGVRSIDYESGVSNRINVAARRALLTGISQVTAKVSEQNMEKLDTEFVEVSWHGTARPSHQVWQGKVYYWDKTNPNAEKVVDGVLYKAFIKETGYGEVDGLCGANCRHTFFPFIPGISVRTYTDEQLEELNAKESEKKEYNGKEYNKYEATQYQRRLETLMRKQRQDIKLLKDAGLSDDSDEVINARCRYQVTSQKYSDFTKKMGLNEHRDRITIDGLKDIGKGKYKGNIEKSIVKATDSDIIKPIVAKEEIEVHTVGKIDRDIYKCITDDIVTDEVIITDERINHIMERHPNDYERYCEYLKRVVEEPDYIIESHKPNTALILKEIADTDGEIFKTILRLTTSVDNPDFKNSIITFMKINKREWNRLLRNKVILYKKE